MNQSFGGYSSKQNDSTRMGPGSSLFPGGSPGKPKPAPAGVLSAKTLAEENLRGFRLRNLQKESDLPLRVNQAQRIELPIYFNTPKRKEDIIARKRLIEKNASLEKNIMNNNSGLTMSYSDSYNRIAAQKRLKDYGILAFACKRAGKSRDEGRAYYSTGVLYDNLGKFKDAINQYQKFLQVCRAIGDVHGEALAYNCVGVDYMKLGEMDPNCYNDAMQYHIKHKEIADVAGKFLAHVNLGIICNAIGNYEQASINHQFALRYAIQMSSVAGQSVAIGNLGKVGGNQVYAQMNQDKMQMFVERYLELSNELKYRKGESGAYMQLGEILTQKGDFDQSTKHFYRAMKISEETNDVDMREQAKVNFGMANASLKWAGHVTGIIQSIADQEAQDDRADAEDAAAGKDEEAVDEAAAEEEEDQQ